MNDLETLPLLIKQAMAALDGATTAAEVLDARDQAKVAYDAAKSAARFLKAKGAHATILAACHQVQADALTIEARAQSRLADEYEAAQKRGEVHKHGGQGKRDIPDKNIPPITDIGLTSKQIHEARQVRDAEKREPGVIKNTLDAKLKAGKEPTRADVKRATKQKRATKSPSKETLKTGVARAGPEKKPTLYCSFCGKSQHEVRKLIAGPTVFICDECVALCVNIIREEENKSWLVNDVDVAPLDAARAAYVESIKAENLTIPQRVAELRTVMGAIEIQTLAVTDESASQAETAKGAVT
jgi:hypothetical protein